MKFTHRVVVLSPKGGEVYAVYFDAEPTVFTSPSHVVGYHEGRRVAVYPAENPMVIEALEPPPS